MKEKQLVMPGIKKDYFNYYCYHGPLDQDKREKRDKMFAEGKVWCVT